MDLHVLCPSCCKPLTITKGHLGKAVRCPGCRTAFQVRPPQQSHPVAFPAPALTEFSNLRLGWATSPGKVRERNEDSLLCAQVNLTSAGSRRDLALLAVFDGMGGHAAGDRAATAAASSLAATLLPRLGALVAGVESFPDSAGLLEILDLALWDANRAIHRIASQESATLGMGATAVVALVSGRTVALCHVGDCRCYLFRDGTVRPLTVDQTLARRMVELGTLTEKQAQNHPSASQVTQALGRQSDIEPSRQIVQLLAGDRLILACDGLHAHLDNQAIATLASKDDPTTAARTLVDAANAAGGTDNCTVVIGGWT